MLPSVELYFIFLLLLFLLKKFQPDWVKEHKHTEAFLKNNKFYDEFLENRSNFPLVHKKKRRDPFIGVRFQK